MATTTSAASNAKTYKNFVNNQWVAAATGETFPVYDPSTEEVIANVAADPATVTRVLPLTSVSRYLERIGDHVKNLAEEVIFMVSATDVRHLGRTPSN